MAYASHSLCATDDASRHFKNIKQKLTEIGCFKPARTFYLANAVVLVLLYGASVFVLYQTNSVVIELAVAAILAGVFTHIGFLVHDAGHREVTANPNTDDVIGYVLGNLGIGLSYGWWIEHHNNHHKEPNHLHNDPDIARRNSIFDVSQAKERKGFGLWVARHQGKVFFPLKLLEAVTLHTTSLKTVLRKDVARPRLELLLLAVHFLAYLGVAFTAMSVTTAIIFIIVHRLTFGVYLGISFATNHKGMPVWDGDMDLSWFDIQVRTSRSLRQPAAVDFMLGGLGYQIEHHLFPYMPRTRLRKASFVVKQYCLENGIPYEETGVLEGYADVVRCLSDVSDKAFRNKTAH